MLRWFEKGYQILKNFFRKAPKPAWLLGASNFGHQTQKPVISNSGRFFLSFQNDISSKQRRRFYGK